MSGFKAKMHQIRFPLGLCPKPRWGSLQPSSRSPSCIKGHTSKEREREREERGGKGRREIPNYTTVQHYTNLLFITTRCHQ